VKNLKFVSAFILTLSLTILTLQVVLAVFP